MEQKDFSFEVALLENTTGESSIKTEISENPFVDEQSIETEISEHPLDDHLIKSEVVEEDFLPETAQEDDTLLEDPLEPTLRKQYLDTQAKLMIINVIRYFQKFRLIRAKETGEDMNVNIAVAEATGVSESAVKKILREYRNKGIESAIRPAAKTRVRKRRNDIVVNVEEAAATVTKKNKRRKK